MATKTPAAKKATTALATAKKPSTALVDVKTALAAQLAGLAGKTAPVTGAAVRVTQDKKFKFPDGTETPGPFEAVIVDFVSIRNFYKGVYNPNDIEPPVCFSVSNSPKGMVPSANSPEKQNPDCDSCPQSQWGSDGKGKACKEGRRMVVVPPDADDQHPLWTLTTSPTAVKPFDGYVGQVARMFGVPPVGVITEVSFDPSQTYASVRLGNPVENPRVAEFFDRQVEAQEMLMIEPDVSSYGQTKAAPARGKAPATRGARR